ncbi:MAG TPA: methyltransferase domain-containing protein [Candidatus Dormibacteraeota bacterium]
MDAVLDVDWVAHWRSLVEARETQIGTSHADDWWAPRAAHYARQVRVAHDWFTDFLEPWLRPAATLLDVGAGTGRYATPLAARLDWVTVVEPSQAMRDQIAPAANMTVIGSSWQDAEPAPADLVICVHVLYPLAKPAPFIEKLERSARERVFVVLRDSPNGHPGEVMMRPGRAREPWLRDCLLLLRQMGIRPEMAMATTASTYRYDSLEVALEQCRSHVGLGWDEERGRAWLEANLRPDEDGTLVYETGEISSGVLHWKPRT